MSLIIATGSNLGDKAIFLQTAKEMLSKEFEFIASSRIYESAAVDYLEQPNFFNQLLEFKIPNITPKSTLNKILTIEKEMGRTREIDKGPRTIDIDIIFWATETIQEKNLSIPHASWDKRSFIAQPLQELPYFKTLEKSFIIPKTFNNKAWPTTS